MSFIFDPSLVLYLPLYELDGASIVSKDKHGHLCTVTGALWTPRGRDFDGTDDFIEVADAPSFDVPGSITLEVWVNLDTAPATDASYQLMDRWIPFIFEYIDISGTKKIGFIYRVAPTTVRKRATFTLATGVFYHLVAVHDTNGSADRIYVNGIERDSVYDAGSFLDPMAASATVIRLGADGGVNSPLDGLIGEARFYSRALTPLEIQHNYLATKWRYQ